LKAKNEINKGELTSTIRTSHRELHPQSSRGGEFLGEKSINATGGTHLTAPFLFFPHLLTTRRPAVGSCRFKSSAPYAVVPHKASAQKASSHVVDHIGRGRQLFLQAMAVRGWWRRAAERRSVVPKFDPKFVTLLLHLCQPPITTRAKNIKNNTWTKHKSRIW
jgi:hypothetical protein